MSRPRAPRLSDEALDGLIELVIIAESGAPDDILGTNIDGDDDTPELRELRRRWHAVESGCAWVRQMQQHRGRS